MAGLDGVAVLITRPEGQAAQLSRLFESNGATVFRLPVMAIEPVGERAALTAAMNPADPFDLVLFTSTNAVLFGAPLLDISRTSVLAAIGPATARALADRGLGAALMPATGFDSESMLMHPALAVGTGKRVLIVTGLHGRALLQQELTLRGAQVVVAAVYERTRIRHGTAALEAMETLLAAGTIDVVTATSAEIAGFILDLATPRMRAAFDVAHWLVPGERVASSLRRRGLTAPILTAASAEDHDLLAEVLRWRSSESGE